MGLRKILKRIKKNTDKSQLVLESLENRTLLDGSGLVDYSISDEVETRVTTGVSAMVEQIAELESYGELATAIPGVGDSLGSMVTPSSIIHDVLQQPIEDYFTTDLTPTVGELVTMLEGVHGQVAGINLDALVPTVSLVNGSYGEELVFSLDINTSKSQTVDFSFNGVDSDIPLNFSDSTVEVTSAFAFDLEFGIELSESVPVSEGFYIKSSDLIFSAAIDADINTEVTIGMLGAEIRDGSFDLSASVSASFVNADGDADGKITRSDLLSYDSASLVDISSVSSNLAGSLPVYAEMTGFSVNGDVAIGMTGGFLAAESIDVALNGVNSGEIEQFFTMDSSSFINILSNLSDWLGDAFDGSSFMQSLPVAGDVSFNDIMTLPATIDGLLESYTSSVDTISLQTFATFIVDQVGSELAQVDTRYDQGANRLSYDISLSSMLQGFDVPVGLDFDMGDLAFYDQAGFCQIDATGTLDFTINIFLDDFQAEVLATRALPSDGKLSGPASFTISANGGESVNIVVEPDDSISSRVGLISHINQSMAAAGVKNVHAEIKYSVTGQGYLKLISTGLTQAQIVVSAIETDPAYTELGLETYMMDRESNLTHIKLEDLTLSVEASVTASGIEANAGVGFIGVGLADIELVGAFGFDLEFIPARNGIYLSKIMAQAGSATAYQMSNDYGTVDISIPTVTLQAGANVQFDASPEITVAASDLLNNPTVTVGYNNFGELSDLKNLAYTQIISMLEDVQGWLGNLETSGVLDFDLLVSDKSLSDLFSPSQELGHLIESYQADPAVSIQDLESKLKDIFENYAQNTVGDSLLNESLVNVEFSDNVLTVDLDMAYVLQQGYNLNLEGDLSSLGFSNSLSDLAFMRTTGQLDIDLSANVNLSFGLDFNSPVPSVFVSDTSQIDFSINGQAGNIDFDVMLGILGVHIVDGQFHIDDGTAAHDPIQMRLSLTEDTVDHRYSLGQLSSASDFSSVTDTNILAVMPIYFPGTNASSYLGDIQFEVSDVLDPLNTTTLTGPDLSSYIAGVDIMDVLNEGLDMAFRQIEGLFENSVGNYELPVIGVSLKDTAGFLIDFLDNDQYGLTQTLAGMNSIAGVQNALLATFGAAGFDVLSDVNLDGIVDLSDIEVASVANGDDFEDVSFSIQLSQQLISEELVPNFSLDIPWLDFNVHDTGSVLFELGYDLNLDFGVSRTDGFYVNTSEQDEFSIAFETSMPGLGAEGNLGFLSMGVGDSAESPSFFNGSLNVDLYDPDGLLTISDFFNNEMTSDIITITPEAQASLNLEFITGINGNDDFPSLRGGFGFDWLVNTSTGFPGELQSFGFSEVQMNLGDYIDNFVEPVLDIVNSVMEPVRPVLDALTTKIDFAIASYSVMDILNVFGTGDYSDITSFITAIAELDTFLQQINTVEGDVWLDFGGVSLDLGSDNTTVSAESWQEPQQDVSQQLSDDAPDFSSDLAGTNSFISFPIIDNPQNLLGILFGQNPTLVACDFPAFSLDESFDQFLGVIPVGPVPVTLGLRGSMGISGDFNFGYDTLGVRNAYAEGSAFAILDGLYISDTDSQGRDIPELEVYGSLGFYGQVGGGFDFGFISAEAKAGVEGGLKTTVTADLVDTDGDGKVRFDDFSGFELDGEISCYVDLYAKVSASFLGISTSTKYTLELVDITLIDFTVSNDENIYNPPVLATMDDGTLYLNMGDRASYALNGGEKPYTVSASLNGAAYKNYLDLDIGSDVSESFEVVNSGSGSVIVKAWGFEQEYGSVDNPITSIVANAGLGDDTVELKGGVAIPSYLYGGAGDDSLKGGTGVDTIIGGSGNDILDGSAGDDFIYGHEIDNYSVNAGNDTIFGGKGDDTIFGGGGDDELHGQKGIDTLYGGSGADTIFGEEDDDIIYGDAGADWLYGNGGIDEIFGGADQDIIVGGAQGDYLYGYLKSDNSNHVSDTDTIYGDFALNTPYVDYLTGTAGDDMIYGQGGDDILFGEAGADTLYGGLGDDTLDGGVENDLLLGESGKDTIFGNTGNDYIYGGLDNDTIQGNLGDDLIDGGAGADIINGNDGQDLIYAGAGNDHVNAGIGNDIVYGGTGHDVLDGHVGDDVLYGEVGDDYLTGGIGNDTIFCGPGNDYAFGRAGADSLYGLSGQNYLWGGLGNDTLTGGSENDIMYGEAGDDRLTGLSGSDTLYGGLGNDWMDGGLGDDTLLGGAGNDTLYGALGDDTLHGNDGHDYIDGGFGIDTIDGGTGNDQLYAGYGSGNTITAGAGDDVLHGADDGADTLYAGSGDDVVWGYGGNDYIEGGDGRDIIYGGDGDDVIMGGLGADVILGQGDHDTIYGDSLTENSEAVDYLYGDFGTNMDETGSGRDQLYGQGGNDIIFGEGDDDKISDTLGTNTINYGSGEGGTPGDIVLPAETPNPALTPVYIDASASSLSYISNTDSVIWQKIAYSASESDGTASSSHLIEPAIAASTTIEGQIYVAWVDSSYGKYDICLSMNVQGNWVKLVDGLGSELLGQDSIQSRSPSLAVDNDGNILISWTDYDSDGHADLFVAKYVIAQDQLEWLGTIGTDGLSQSGDVQDTRLVITADGPVVFWLAGDDASQINTRQYSNGQWTDFGGSLSVVNTSTDIVNYDIDVNGNNVLLTWSQNDTANDSVVHITQWNGSQWQTLTDISSIYNAIDSPVAAAMPTAKYYNDTIYLAWTQQSQGREGIAVATYAGSQWSNYQLFEAGLSETCDTPILTANNDGLQLTWLAKNTDAINTVQMVASKLDQTADTFALPIYTELDSRQSTVDSYNSFDIAEGQSSLYAVWQDINTGISLAVNDGFESIHYVTDDSSIQQLLDDNDFGPGDVIYLAEGLYDGFEVSSDDAGVTLLGAPGFAAVISSQITINAADNVHFQNLQINSDLAIANSQGVVIVANEFDNAVITLTGTVDCSIESNTLSQGGIELTGSEVNVTLWGNYITSGITGIALDGAASGRIAENHISHTTTGIDIQNAFTGLITHNDIAQSDTGIDYNAAADLSFNTIHDCGTGMAVSVSNRPDAPGIYGLAQGNVISNNDTGVLLENGYLANQTLTGNTIGVRGTGTLGGNDFSEANTLEYNQTAVSLDAGSIIAYNAIGHNNTGIFTASNQTITHNVLYDNTANGIVVSNAQKVYIVNNTIYSQEGNSIQLTNNAEQVEIVNNILWSENGYAINVANNSREGFYSDYNVLYCGAAGHLVRWVVDFDDILDWQVDVGLFDANSIGRTEINPDGAKPRFTGMASDDYSLIETAAGLRFTSPAQNTANQAIDLGLSADFVNLLANPGFESGLSGWTVSDGSLTVENADDAFTGDTYYTAGQSAQGTAIQVVDLATAGYTSEQIDQGDLFAVFGGRLRSADELFYDNGTIRLEFLDSSGGVIVSSELTSQGQHRRWELSGNRIAIPQGTREIRYTYIADRQVENNDASNDAFLDSAFLQIRTNTTSMDMGAFAYSGNDEPSDTPSIAVTYPEMYLDWERDISHTIRWDTYGNSGDLPVKIDLYQETSEGFVFVQTIDETSDDGEYLWIPADSGVNYGDYGLKIVVSLVGSEITFDSSTEYFNIPENTTEFYVNDSSTDGDQYTTAPGNNRNTGRTPASPKPTPVNLLNVYSLGAGDELFVDTGDYQLLYPVLLSGTIGVADDEGFVFSGPSDTQNLAQLSLVDPAMATTPTVILDNADYVTMNDFVLSGGYMGLFLTNDSTYFTGNNLVCNNNVSDGISVDKDSSLLSLSNSEASGNGNNGITIVSGSLQPQLINITADNNSKYGLYATTAISRLADSQASNNGLSGFYLRGQVGITVENVTAVANHGDGLYVYGPVESITGSDFHYNTDDGVELSYNSTTTFENNQIYSNNDYGLDAYNSSVQISGHDIYGNGNYGLRVGSDSVVTHNNIYQNGNGISASYSQVSGNNIYDNANYGVYATSGTLEYNLISGNSTYGIYLNSSAVTVQHNVIHSNDTGIYDYSYGSTIQNNRIYNNASTGIMALRDTQILENVIYSNPLAIYTAGEYTSSYAFYGTIANNLIYANQNGISVINAREYYDEHPQIINNTIYQTSGYAISVSAVTNQSSDNVEIKNNVITVLSNGYGIKVDQRSQTAFDSDYNLFDIAETAYVGFWQGMAVDSLQNWNNMAFSDSHSIQGAPNYVDPAGTDGILGYSSAASDGRDDNFHLQSLYGSVASGNLAPVIDAGSDTVVYQPIQWQSYASQSPAIDSGDAQADYANEPAENGGYINLGAYGNTAQASLSPQEYILVTSPQGGELWPNGQEFSISWRSDTSSTTALVDLFLIGSGSQYQIADDTLNDGQYSWQVPDSIMAGSYYIAIVRSDDTHITGDSNYFDIMEHDGKYYVNIESDTDFTDNEYTIASGNQANSGLTSSTPKSSIRGIIQNYDLRPGDVIYVDTGDYALSSNIVITADDYGFAITGPTGETHQAILNRNNLNSGNYVFEYDGSFDVLLENIELTGAFDGLHSDTSASGIAVINTAIYGNSNHGINLTGDVNTIKLQYNSIHDNSKNGMYIDGDDVVISDNLIFNNGQSGLVVEHASDVFVDSNNLYNNTNYGIYMSDSSAKVTANTVSGNDIGIYAKAQYNTFPVQVSNNEVFDNAHQGIYAEYNVLVTGNEVYGHVGDAYRYGIHVSNNAKALYNESYSNEVGVYAGYPGYARSATVVGNVTYDNQVGIDAGYQSVISENTSYSNKIGIRVGAVRSFYGTVSHNVVYANSDCGIAVSTGQTGMSLVNNTIYQSTGDAVQIYNNSKDVQLVNNIIYVESGHGINIVENSYTGFTSDYNILHTEAGGAVAKWGATTITDRADWYYELGFDRHSYDSDPSFVDMDGTDDILGYDVASGMNYGDDDNFHITGDSEAVDGGDLSMAPTFEMYPNGGRVNLGAYGDTFGSTTSAPNTIQITSPIALDKYEYGDDIDIVWRTAGMAGGLGDVAITLEYSTDAGTSWHPLASNLTTESDGTGSYLWDADVVAEEIIVRITGNDDAGIDLSDQSSIFQIGPDSNSYFVNSAGDVDFSDNEYTLAAGDNRNSGKSPVSPMASLSALLNIYDLAPGDIVYVDSGVYNVLNTVVVDSRDAGVTITGPTESGHQALFNRNDTSTGISVLELIDADNVVIENLAFTGGDYGIYVYGTNDQTGPVLRSNNVYDNKSYGIFILNTATAVTANSVSENNIGIYAKAQNNDTFPVQISNNEVFNNNTQGIYAEYNVLVTANKVYGHEGINHYGIHVRNDAKALYNESYGNKIGIYAGDSSYYGYAATVVGNVVYDNHVGIDAGYQSTISENKAYSNDIGIRVGTVRAFSGTISHNIVYANSDYGIVVNGGQTGLSLLNNTIYQSTGDAVQIYNNSEDVQLVNNIIYVESGYCLNVEQGSYVGFTSDYNLFYAASGGTVAKWGDTTITDRADWYYELGFDRHSYDSDPSFVDMNGADNIFGYDAQSGINYGYDDNFHITGDSEAVDGGDLSMVPAFEMYPNGGRVNLGAYGNTFNATPSSPTTIQITSPIALDKYEYGDDIDIVWRTSGMAGGLDDVAITLEYSTDAGTSWHPLASNLATEADGTGSYLWDADVVAEEIIVRINGKDDTDIDVSDQSSIFQIGPDSNSYYINSAGDVDFSDNEYTLAAGDNRNNGKSPASPMASLRALLDVYDLTSGDIVYVDSGVYNVLNNMVIDSCDAGVTIIGPSESGHQALFDRNDTATDSNVLELVDAENVVIENLSFTGGNYGIYVFGTNDQSGPVLRSNNVYGNESYGIFVSKTPATVTANSVSGNDIGIYANGYNNTFPIQVSDNNVFSNDSQGIFAEYNVLVTGNEVYGHEGANHYGIHVRNDAKALYNESYGNEIGIYAGDSYYSLADAVVGNVVYDNYVGIDAVYRSVISENKAYSNDIGIRVGNTKSFSGTVSNNVVYANTDFGIIVSSGYAGSVIANNTIYQPIGDAIQMKSNCNGVQLVNNILTIDTGHCLNIETGSDTNLSSDHNLFYRFVPNNSYVVRVGLMDIVDLAQWQTGYSQDANSVQSDPLFVDMDGADEILGYQQTPIHINNGLDDNFVISKNSPAIDTGFSWLFNTNINHDDDLDDPGVENAGSPDYYHLPSTAESFTETEGAKNWRSSDRVWTSTLSTPFSFYGIDYTTIYVSTSGAIQLGTNSNLLSSDSSIQNLLNQVVIAPYWGDIDTSSADDNIYIDTQAGVVTVRWDATSKTDGSDVDFTVSLFDTGKITFNYQEIAPDADPVIGIFSGNGKYELVNISEISGQLAQVDFNLLPGFVDIGAYEFAGSSLDETAPVVITSNPDIIHNSGHEEAVVDQINLTFSEPLNEIDALSVSNYTLLSYGPNQVEGDADDYTVEVRPVYNAGTTIVNLDIPSGELPIGLYKFTINSDSMHDVSGLSLSSDYIREFEITSHMSGPIESLMASWVVVDAVADDSGGSSEDDVISDLGGDNKGAVEGDSAVTSDRFATQQQIDDLTSELEGGRSDLSPISEVEPVFEVSSYQAASFVSPQVIEVVIEPDSAGGDLDSLLLTAGETPAVQDDNVISPDKTIFKNRHETPFAELRKGISNHSVVADRVINNANVTSIMGASFSLHKEQWETRRSSFDAEVIINATIDIHRCCIDWNDSEINLCTRTANINPVNRAFYADLKRTHQFP